MAINNRREIRIITVCIIATLTLIAGLCHYLAMRAYDAYAAYNNDMLKETLIFCIASFFLAYGTMLYQICLLGYYKRREQHNPVPRETIEKLYNGKAPSLSVLVPSYKEERMVIWQTLMSAALSEYPEKNVILLIDDPYHARALEDIIKLEDTRTIPAQLQTLFAAPLARYRAEFDAFHERQSNDKLYAGIELNRLSILYDEVAAWLETLSSDFLNGRKKDELPYTDRFFVDAVLGGSVEQHHATAKTLRQQIESGEVPEKSLIEQHYARLVGLFNIHFTSFERKKYSNLSHEANKAMNLNSYIGLMGKSWEEVEVEDGLELRETTPENADFTIAGSDYVNTIDADSMMLSDYVLRLIHLMEQQGNEKLAVVQSPVSSFPGCTNPIERVAGACIDVQYHTHQGYTYWDASFWVGANAMLRRRALEEIKEIRHEGNNEIAIYIQDHTVIEDTESTIDLVHKGWQLYNYPERMTFSATPSDFGSLLIQRRRWSNGGLLILPKLFRYAFRAPKTLSLFKEMFMRFHYLASTTSSCAVALLFFTYPFGEISANPWLSLATIPFFFLFMRDLKNAGYKYSDALRICSLNLMLFPIVVGGVLKQFQQMLTGKKIPFGRTPKITGRTAAPALYCFAEIALFGLFSFVTVHNIARGNWPAASFSAVNTLSLGYAITHFMGIKATAEDLVADIRTRWRNVFYTAQIIPISTARWVPISLPRARKRA